MAAQLAYNYENSSLLLSPSTPLYFYVFLFSTDFYDHFTIILWRCWLLLLLKYSGSFIAAMSINSFLCEYKTERIIKEQTSHRMRKQFEFMCVSLLLCIFDWREKRRKEMRIETAFNALCIQYLSCANKTKQTRDSLIFLFILAIGFVRQTFFWFRSSKIV